MSKKKDEVGLTLQDSEMLKDEIKKILLTTQIAFFRPPDDVDIYDTVEKDFRRLLISIIDNNVEELGWDINEYISPGAILNSIFRERVSIANPDSEELKKSIIDKLKLLGKEETLTFLKSLSA